MRHALIAIALLVSVLAVAQQPCPSGYHHEGNSSACWPDVSKQEQPDVAQPPQSQPSQTAAQGEQSKASISFFRRSAFYGSALKPSVYVDGEEVGRLGSGKYLVVNTTARSHTLSSSKKGTTIDVTLGSGQTQYVEMLIQNGKWRGAGRLVAIPTQEGSEKTKKLKLEQ